MEIAKLNHKLNKYLALLGIHKYSSLLLTSHVVNSGNWLNPPTTLGPILPHQYGLVAQCYLINTLMEGWVSPQILMFLSNFCWAGWLFFWLSVEFGGPEGCSASLPDELSNNRKETDLCNCGHNAVTTSPPTGHRLQGTTERLQMFLACRSLRQSGYLRINPSSGSICLAK